MSGHYRMARGWQDHEVFGNDPYSRRDAWVWIIEHAAWADHTIIVGGKRLTLRRGQLCHAYRHLADTWKWSVAAVQRYVARLQANTMIECSADTGRLVITVCNYEIYQAGRRIADTEPDTASDTPAEAPTDTRGTSAPRQTDTPAIRDRYASDTPTDTEKALENQSVGGTPDTPANGGVSATRCETDTKNKEENKKKELNGGDEGARLRDEPPILDAVPVTPLTPVPTILTARERHELGDEVAGIIGAKDNPNWFGDYGRIQTWLLQGADPGLILTTIRGVMAKRREPSPPRTLNYFDEPMARAIASRYAPLPEVSPHVEHGHPASRNHVSRAPGGDPSLAKRAALAAVANLHGVDCFDAAAE